MNHHDDGENDSVPEELMTGEEDDEYIRMIHFQSIREPNGLETAISVKWQGMERAILISTLLEEDDLAPLFAGAQWAGTRVWHAAICMMKYLADNHQDDLKTPNCQLLELGCGLGVPGMLCNALYDTKTYLTDQESILSQLKHNIQENFDPVSSELYAKALDWSREAVQDLLQETGPFDFVINCDCVYEPLYGESWKLLADVMEELLQVNPKTIMLTSCERRNGDSIDNFLERLRTSEHISSVDKVWADKEFKIEIYLARGTMC
jgi:predicted nicotinamide N-methyase